MKAATAAHYERRGRGAFQSTPPVKAATRLETRNIRLLHISIHAAREGGDHCGFFFLIRQPISIHAAREGGDLRVALDAVGQAISIHAAREGGDQALFTSELRQGISIHAAREGGD